MTTQKLATVTKFPSHLDQRLAEQGIEVQRASQEVLKRLGLSRQRWNRMTPAERIEALQARVARDENKTDVLAHMPAEPEVEDDNPVVWFQKRWGGDTVYSYVAIKTPDGWLVSGQHKQTYKTWTQVLLFALLREADNYDPNFHLGVEWEKMERRP